MKARYLIIIAVVLVLISIVALRFNNKKSAVLAKQIRDKDSLSTDVAPDIIKLQQFVVKHMNSSVKFELTASYDRAVAAAQGSNVSGEVYAQAQAACDRQGIGSIAQAQCVQQFLNERVHPEQNAQPKPLPDRAPYNYAFAAPTWTPDIAGFSLLGALLFAVSALVVYIVGMFKRGEPPV